MRRASTFAGMLAWVFVVWNLLLSLAAPDWLQILTLFGFLFSVIASATFSWTERKRHPGSKRLGLWLGVSALAVFVAVALIPPLLPR
jgi:hypothetical protein